MSFRLKTHIEECKIPKSDSGWIGVVIQNLLEATENVEQHHPIAEFSDAVLYLDVYLTVERVGSKYTSFSHVRPGVHVGRIRSTSHPLTVTVHYQVHDLKELSLADVEDLLESDCDNALSIVRSRIEHLT